MLFHSLLLLHVPDLKKSRDFYVKKLSFEPVEYLNTKEPHICLYKDDVEIILMQSKCAKIIPNREMHGYGYDGYFIVKDGIDNLYENLLKNDVKIIRELQITDYNNKEFVIEDIDGRWICFGAKIFKSE